jgi:hypothetical protein
MCVFGSADHHIHARQAQANEANVVNADFLLIDPPGLQSPAQQDYPAWGNILESLDSLLVVQRPFMLWLPVNANTTGGRGNVTEGQQSEDCRNACLQRGCRVTKVRWATGGRTIGCQLIYRLQPFAVQALRDAVVHVVQLAGWQGQLGGVQSVTHFD